MTRSTKTFSSRRVARAALVSAGFEVATIDYRIIPRGEGAGRIEPRIICRNETELAKAQRAGFDAEIVEVPA